MLNFLKTVFPCHPPNRETEVTQVWTQPGALSSTRQGPRCVTGAPCNPKGSAWGTAGGGQGSVESYDL